MQSHIISPPIFNDLPIQGFFTGKTPGADIKELSGIYNLPASNFYLPVQKHTDHVLVLDSDREPKTADAVVTKEKGVLIGVQVADCAPILLYDRKKGVAGAVHAGWRGAASGILKNTLKVMRDRFDSSPSDILIAIGPSIRWCCYNVGPEVIEAVQGATDRGDYFLEKSDKYYLDLASANKYQALSMGILPENIWISDDCTFCLPGKYYSYRYARGASGRQAGFIGIV